MDINAILTALQTAAMANAAVPAKAIIPEAAAPKAGFAVPVPKAVAKTAAAPPAALAESNPAGIVPAAGAIAAPPALASDQQLVVFAKAVTPDITAPQPTACHQSIMWLGLHQTIHCF